MRTFRNRRDAGRQLAAVLAPLGDDEPVVVGLPRGGVPVAAEVAEALGARLDVIVVRKLGVPFQPELGMGAIGEGGVRVLNDDVVRIAGVSAREVAEVEDRERAELERRARRFRGDRAAVPLAGRTVIVVDDGIATGGTARAAVEVARAHGASRVVLAVPVAPPDVVTSMREVADDVVCLATPVAFSAVGQWYEDFTQTSDAEVERLLDANAAASDPAVAEVTIPVGAVELAGQLAIPAAPRGVVVFAHGSGSSRHSPRNRYVAQVLQDEGLATLLFDLLTPEEEIDRHNVFDVELLGRRLAVVTEWLGEQPTTGRLPTGYFGASTGAAAALWAAAEPGSRVCAVVSRRGSPRPGRPSTPRGAGADAPRGGRPRRGGARAQPRGGRGPALRAPDRGRPRRDPSLRGERHPRGRRPPRRRLVPRPPLTVAQRCRTRRRYGEPMVRWGKAEVATPVSVTAAGSPGPADRNGSDLCLECGICCDGTLFGAIVVHIPEREFVESLGIPVSEDPDGGWVAPLPCAAFVEGCCSLYAVGRPMTCGSYQCAVVMEYTAGSVDLDDSLVVIDRVRSLARDLEVEMGLPPAGYSMTVLAGFLADHEPWVTPERHRRFLVTFSEFEVLAQ